MNRSFHRAANEIAVFYYWNFWLNRIGTISTNWPCRNFKVYRALAKGGSDVPQPSQLWWQSGQLPSKRWHFLVKEVLGRSLVDKFRKTLAYIGWQARRHEKVLTFSTCKWRETTSTCKWIHLVVTEPVIGWCFLVSLNFFFFFKLMNTRKPSLKVCSDRKRSIFLPCAILQRLRTVVWLLPLFKSHIGPLFKIII